MSLFIMVNYTVVFDDVIKESFEKAIMEGNIKTIFKQWFDDLETLGPNAGKLLDNHVWLYEMKNKHPPLRLYYHYQKALNKIIIFDFEMKTSEKKQNQIIKKLTQRLSKFLNLYVYTLLS